MSGSKLFSLLLCLLAYCAGYTDGFTANNLVYPGQNEFFELSIVHLNDFHARWVIMIYACLCVEKLKKNSNIHLKKSIHSDIHSFLQTSFTSGTCHKGRDLECVGGLGRVVTATRQLMQERPNAIFLNAGDHYQGTLWYNVHKWNATVHFMNKLPHDVMVCIIHSLYTHFDWYTQPKVKIVIILSDIIYSPELKV